jgi:hypothetical protein
MLAVSKVICATCCHGDQIGVLGIQNRFSMFGYRGQILIPTVTPYLQQFSSTVLAGPNHVAGGGAAAQAAAISRSAYSRLAQRLQGTSVPADKFAAMVAGMLAGRVDSW